MDHTYTITLYAIAHKYMRFHMKFSNKTCPLWPNHQHNQEKVVLFLHQAVSVTLFRLHCNHFIRNVKKLIGSLEKQDHDFG